MKIFYSIHRVTRDILLITLYVHFFKKKLMSMKEILYEYIYIYIYYHFLFIKNFIFFLHFIFDFFFKVSP